MTEQDYIDLSKRVAEKLGLVPNDGDKEFDLGGNPYYVLGKWLHQDSARCFDLAGEHALLIEHGEYRGFVVIRSNPLENWKEYRERYADHNNDRNLSARIAILKALEVL